MEAKISPCKKCTKDTKHRHVKNDSRGYYICSICTEKASVKHRKLHWYKYLSQKANARKREGSIKLIGEEVEALAIRQNFTCALTGVKLDLDSKWYKPSLDRIDSNLGYVLANIRIVAWIVNHAKGSLTDLEFVDMCEKVSFNKRSKYASQV